MLESGSLGKILCWLAFPLQAVMLLVVGDTSGWLDWLAWLCGPAVLAGGLALNRQSAPAASFEQELALVATGYPYTKIYC